MTPKIIELLKNLIEFKSLTPNDDGCLDYISNFLQTLDAKCEWVNRGQTKNLIATIGSGELIFAFAGHVDVVPCGDVKLWTGGDPFKLQHLEDNRLIGRGVADMKGSIVAFLLAVDEFVKTTKLIDTEYKIMLLLTSDEEGSALDGTTIMVDFLKANNISLNYCLVGEPSCANVFGDCIKIGRRGSLTGELTVTGKQGHIAYPHLCNNPIHAVLPILNELSSTKWDNGNEYFPATSFQIANFNSGVGVTNVITGVLTANFNFRYNNLHTPAELKQRVIDGFEKNKINYSIVWSDSARPFLTNLGKLVEISQQSI